AKVVLPSARRWSAKRTTRKRRRYYALMGHILYSRGDDAAALEAFKVAIVELEEASAYSGEEKKMNTRGSLYL
ncbi:MAG TPA: hypothetical protein VHH93_03070, partial [Gammaproteobacteria bacterium]|nr:hypothetical protein [Gammaproteobacteria bacterium]